MCIIVLAGSTSSKVTSIIVPDLDQSVASVARHHLSSGSVSSIVSVSGDYCDSTGKLIKRYRHRTITL